MTVGVVSIRIPRRRIIFHRALNRAASLLEIRRACNNLLSLSLVVKLRGSRAATEREIQAGQLHNISLSLSLSPITRLQPSHRCRAHRQRKVDDLPVIGRASRPFVRPFFSAQSVQLFDAHMMCFTFIYAAISMSFFKCFEYIYIDVIMLIRLTEFVSDSILHALRRDKTYRF